MYRWRVSRWRIKGVMTLWVAIGLLLAASAVQALVIYILYSICMCAVFAQVGLTLLLRHRMYKCASHHVGIRCRPFGMPPADSGRYREWRRERGLPVS